MTSPGISAVVPMNEKKQQWPSAEWGSLTLGGEGSHSRAAADSQMCSDVNESEAQRRLQGGGFGWKCVHV